MWNKDSRRKSGGYWRCYWRCFARHRRYREANREKVTSSNARRLMVSGMYLGRVGFTESEIKEMISGTTD